MIKQLIWPFAFIALCFSGMVLNGQVEKGVDPFLLIAQDEAQDEAIFSPTSATNEQIVSVKMVVDSPSIQPGKPFWVCFQFTMAPDWHLYWKNPGDAGLAPVVHWNLPQGFRVSDLQWPVPERIDIDQSVIFGYSKKLLLLAQIFPPQELELDSKVEGKVDIDWLACSHLCVPGQASFDFQLNVAQVKEAPSKQVASIFKQARKAMAPVAKFAKVNMIDHKFEIRLTQAVPFSSVKNVLFFPEQQDLFDPHVNPTWLLINNNQTLVVHTPERKQSSAIQALKGILVVEEEGPIGPKKRAWEIKYTGGEKEAKSTLFETKYERSKETKFDNTPRVSAGSEQFEALESKVWYRRFLTDFTHFLHSDLLKVLLAAFFGGIILNIMPCVLPVISFKLLHFVQLQGYSRTAVTKHGVLYSFGILISFWVLGATIYVLQSFGKVIGWGFQLQEPIFVTVLIILLFILALSLFGVFEMGVSVSSTAGAWDQSFKNRIPTSSEQPSLTSSFASGVLATLVATPCTGPLLGSAIGFAATLQPTYSFAIFSALGLGMAFPFLLISFFPGLTKLLPKPGRWMLTFKQLMGFLMLATVLWLVWVLDAQTSGLSNLKLLLSLFIIAIGTWIYGNWGSLDREKRTRIIGKIAALIFVVAGSWLFIANVHRARATAERPLVAVEKPSSQVVGKEWEVFSLPSLERYVQKGIPVFVSVGAKWCLTCQTNHLVLETEKVKEAFVRYGVVKMEADWTTNDENVTRYLRSLGRNGVPVYALYSLDPHAHPVILPEIITPDTVIEALKKVRDEGGDEHKVQNE